MKAIKLFSMAVAALMMAACSNEDNDVQQPAQPQATKMHFTATIAAPNSTTRTVYTPGKDTNNKDIINVAWKEGDQIALIHGDVKDVVTVGTPNADGSAPISGDITVGTDGEDVTLAYPAAAVYSATPYGTFPFTPDPTCWDKAHTQDGTLEFIQNNIDFRMGSGKLSVSGDPATASLKESVTMPSMISIWKLTLQDNTSAALSATAVTVKADGELVAGATSTAKSAYYLCMVPSFIPAGDLVIEATVGSDTYTYTKAGGVSLETSKYYQSTVTLSKTDPDYLKWDGTQKKLVATEIPTDATAVSNASGNVNWAAGTYVVDGNVTISGVISLQGAVNLIIKDGAKLTVGKIDGANYDLSIFGQSNMTGELVVRHNNLHAIQNLSTLEIHSCKVTAIGVLNARYGFNDIGTINVYGGSVDAKATGGTGDGICLRDAGSMNIYGGLVKAEGKGSFNNYCYGVEGSATITVYGGKLWAGSPNKQAFKSNVTLTTGANFTGKIQTSDDNTTWTDWTTDGTPTTKYVKVE